MSREKETSYHLHRRYIALVNKLYDRKDEDPIFMEAHFMLDDLINYIKRWEYICVCTLCGEEYWCHDVDCYCPSCGTNVPEIDQLNWTIDWACQSPDYIDYMNKKYKERGDWPLMPKYNKRELIEKEIADHHKCIKRLDPEHTRYDEIVAEHHLKIKKLEDKLKELDE